MSIDIVGMIIMMVLLIFLLAFPILLIWGFVRSIRAKRLVWSAILGGVTLLVLGVYAPFFYANAPLGNKLIARATAPDGTEIVLFQKCNYSAEPYHTHFYFREPESPWQSYQIDFEDTRWLSGRIDIDPNDDRVTVYRGKEQVARFSLSTYAFTMGNYTQTNAYEYAKTAATPWNE